MPQPGEVVADGPVDHEKLMALLALLALSAEEALDLCLRAPRTSTALLRGKPCLTTLVDIAYSYR